MSPKSLLESAHYAMAAALAISLFSVLLAYGLNEQLSLGVQIAAHIMLILMPAVLKVGYVLRLAALKEMGLRPD